MYIKTHEVRQKSKDHVLGWLRWLYAQFGAVCHSNKSLSQLTGYSPQYIKTVLHQFLADGAIEQDTWVQTRQNRAGWEYFKVLRRIHLRSALSTEELAQQLQWLVVYDPPPRSPRTGPYVFGTTYVTKHLFCTPKQATAAIHWCHTHGLLRVTESVLPVVNSEGLFCKNPIKRWIVQKPTDFVPCDLPPDPPKPTSKPPTCMSDQIRRFIEQNRESVEHRIIKCNQIATRFGCSPNLVRHILAPYLNPHRGRGDKRRYIIPENLSGDKNGIRQS